MKGPHPTLRALVALSLICLAGCTEEAEAAEATPQEAPPPPPSPFANQVNTLATAMINYAEGRPPGTGTDASAWLDGRGEHQLTMSDRSGDVTPLFNQLGPQRTHAFTTVTFNAYDAAWTQRVRAVATVFPDGRVRWTGFQNETENDSRMRRLLRLLGDFPTNGDPASQQLVGGFSEVLSSMRGDCDSIELLHMADVMMLPARARHRVAPADVVARRHGACTHATQHGLGAGMSHLSVGGVSVYMVGNDRIIRLRSSIWKDGRDTWLSTVSADDFDTARF